MTRLPKPAPLDLPPGAVIGYTRLSVEEGTSVSLDMQAERIRSFAKAMGMRVDSVVSDNGASARNLKRPQMQRLIASIEAGKVKAVVVWRLDRLSRSLKDIIFLVDLLTSKNVALLSVNEVLNTSTASGKAMLYMLGVFAQFERDSTSERQKASSLFKRSAGKVYAAVPMGYRRGEDNALLPDPVALKAVARAKQMREEGVSLKSIGEWLSAEGFNPPQGGKKFYPATVRAILSSQIRKMEREGLLEVRRSV